MRKHFLTRCASMLVLLVACSDDAAPVPEGAPAIVAGDAREHPAAPPSAATDAGKSARPVSDVVGQGSATATESDATEAGSAGSSTGAGVAVVVTYHEHIKPFMDAKCVRCHVEGTVAPFSLATYALAKGFAKPSLAAVRSGKMPPWKFDEGCNEYTGDFSLTDQEKQLLERWVEQGTPEGDPSKPGAAVAIGDTRLSRVDLSLTIPEPYTPQQRPDEYRCFPVPWPKEKTAFMTGFHPVAGAPRVVHHIEVYHVPKAQAATVQGLDQRDPGPGYTCFSGPGAGSGTIGGWAPGSPGYDYPDGVGIQIEPGALIVIQVHYNTSGAEPEPDQSKVEMKVDDRAIKGGYSFWMNTRWAVGHQMSIPAGQADVKHTWNADPTSMLASGKPMLLYSAGIHMHNLGKTGYLKLKRKSGGEECMVRISDWDFHWQGGVRFKKPIPIQPGDQLEMQCGFDNSAANQPLGPDGEPLAPRDVNWGEGTADEMCLGTLLWGPQQ